MIGAPRALSELPVQTDLSGCGGAVVAPVNAAFEQQVVDLVNQQRLLNGNLPPLKRVAVLDNASRYHSTDMVQDSYFDHDTYDRVNGVLSFRCDFGTRLLGFYNGGVVALGENIAAGQSTPAGAMSSWMNSDGHRANILTTSMWSWASATPPAEPYRHYWTQDFGRRRTVFPLVINREAASTSSPNVQLYVYGNWTEIRLRNENGAFGPWMPFHNNLSWTLSAGPAGLRTVTAEMRSGATTTSSSDDILLDTGAATSTPTPVPVARGDCNADGLINAADLSAIPLEVADGDGQAAAAAAGGSFRGSPVGCDSNRDGLITAGDISCTVLILFNGPAACP